MKLFIFGANWNNRGDESAIRAMIDEIRDRDKSIEIKIQFFSKVTNFPYSDIEIIPAFIPASKRKDLLNWLANRIVVLTNGQCNLLSGDYRRDYFVFMKAVNWCDYAIYAPGGPCIGDIYKSYFLLDEIKLISNKVRYFFYAPSMGPFTKNRKRIKRCLEKADEIVLRESISKSYVENLGVKNDCVVTLDSAFQHIIDDAALNQCLKEDADLFDFMNSGKKIIGMTITDLKWHADWGKTLIGEQIHNVFSEFISDIVSQGYNVIFIPQLFGSTNDKLYMEKYVQDGCYVLSDKYDCYFQQFIISRLYAVIGLRYHSNIFSAKMGTPFISISYEQKMRGFMEDSQLEQFCIDISDLSFDTLKEKFGMLEKSHAEYKEKLSSKQKIYRNKSRETTDRLFNRLATLSNS